MSIGELLKRCADAAPEATAVISAGRAYDFGVLAEASRRIAAQLTPGTRVLARIDNTPASVVAIHAAWMAGCSVVSASPMVPDAEVARRAETTGTSSVLTPRGSQGLEVSIGAAEGATPAPAGEALVMFTSGTTGAPKGASLTFGALQASVAGIAAGSGLGKEGRLPRVPARDPQLILVPLAHMGGFLGTLSAWWLGKPMLLTEKFSAGLIFDLVQQYRLGVLKLTPAMVWDLVQADSDGPLPGISSATVGTAALPEATRIAFERKYGVPILRNYGQTEFAGAIAFERPDDVAAGIRPDNTVGRVAPGVEVMIVDADGNRLTAGEVGEITARATSAMSGYLDGEGRPSAPGTWLHTGDLGVIDDDGFLAVVGRLRDTIICGGFNVYPAQLEAALNRIVAVADSAVVGIPDERLGEIPVAAVVLNRGEQVTSDGIRAELRTSLAPYELPREVVAVAEIPRLPTGKVDRAGVSGLFQEQS